MCTCRSEVETTKNFLLRCHFYSSQRLELFENLEKFDPSTSKSSNHDILKFEIKCIKKLLVLIKLFVAQTNNIIFKNDNTSFLQIQYQERKKLSFLVAF